MISKMRILSYCSKNYYHSLAKLFIFDFILSFGKRENISHLVLHSVGIVQCNLFYRVAPAKFHKRGQISQIILLQHCKIFVSSCTYFSFGQK